MSQTESKTRVTGVRVTDFIDAIENATRRTDAEALVRIFSDVTGWKAQMWGPTIVGFGAYHYTYESGRTGSICAVGFSPRKANLAIYCASFPGVEKLLAQLGKHKGGGDQCLYLNKLADVDVDVLKKILARSIVALRKQWPVTAS